MDEDSLSIKNETNKTYKFWKVDDRIAILPLDPGTNLVPDASFRKQEKKETLEHFKQVLKICPNREHIFQNKLRNMWTHRC